MLQLDPQHADALHLLGVTLTRRRDGLTRGIELIQKAITLRPNISAYHENLGIALLQSGDHGAAIPVFQHALSLDGSNAQTWFNLGYAMRACERFDRAITAYDSAIALNPRFLEAISNRALTMQESDRDDEAIEEYERALLEFPTSAELWRNLGVALLAVGQLQRAADAFVHCAADPQTAGTPLYLANYLPETTAHSLLGLHRQWVETYADPLLKKIGQHTNDRVPDRRLRIGFTGPDFYTHPVGRFLVPLFAQHDASQFEFVCYSDTTRVDEITQQLRESAQLWHATSQLSDEELAALVRKDHVDILIDLTMHTRGGRMLVYARKPAPVQATYLAYVGTTGLPTVDYRFTDSFLDRDVDGWVERPMALSSFWCYRAVADTGAVSSPPADSNGFITFGCLNACSKINSQVCRVWASILDRVPGSRLLLHMPRGKSRDAVRQFFGNRVEFVARIPRPAYFALHSRIDIALDPFPYPGGTTTCDALWMGVPVVTLGVGNLPMARAGASILGNANLPELVAKTPEQYADIAVALAGDRSRLRSLRAGLRDRLRASPLMDEVGFTRSFESALRRMWTAWCDAGKIEQSVSTNR